MSILTEKMTRTEEASRAAADRNSLIYSREDQGLHYHRDRASRRAAQWLKWKRAQPGCEKATAPAWCTACPGSVAEWREVNQRPPAQVYPVDLCELAREPGWQDRKRAAAAATAALAAAPRPAPAKRVTTPPVRTPAPAPVRAAPAARVARPRPALATYASAAAVRTAAANFPEDRVLTLRAGKVWSLVVTGSTIDRDMIALALRPHGATRRDFAACSATQQPWTERLKRAAARYGLAYDSTSAQGRTTYFLRP